MSAPITALSADDADRPRRRYPPAYASLALVIGIALAVASLGYRPAREDQIVELEPSDVAGVETPTGDPESTVTVPGADTGAGGPTQREVVRKGTGATAGANGPGGAGQQAGVECAAGKNGGGTDTGVTANQILLGATVVQSGIGESFLGDVRFAMQSVVDKTNRKGGVCGRRLKLELVDDGWSFQQGGDYLRNLVEDKKVFALAVVPSSEGLKNVSDANYLQEKKVPVVGSDGMLDHQYRDPYIWPVAASTVSTMHIMVKQAHDAGAKDFGLVYERSYHFGIEGAFAFNAAVKRLTGKDVDGYSNPLTQPGCALKFCGISSEQDAYGSEINIFNGSCAPVNNCHFIGLLLEPTTAQKWMNGGGLRPNPPSRRMGGPQPLFTYDFGTNCGAACDQLWLWTGYTPPLGDFLGQPAIAQYVNDIKGASRNADYNNSFVEGGYIGMSLMVKALETVGPTLTRERLKAALDGMTFESGLAPPLSWSEGNHFANTKMRAFSMQYKSGFTGWRDEQVTYDDPWIGQDGEH